MTVEDWAASGLAALTGQPDGPPDFCRAPVLPKTQATLARFIDDIGAVTGDGPTIDLNDLDAGQLLSARAALNGFERGGTISAGRGTRLLAARGGWLAITLSRDSDLELLPALLQLDADPADPWAAVTAAVGDVDAADFVDRARLLGLPAAQLGETPPRPPRIRPRGQAAAPHRDGLLVVDLASLWAGPLCGQLLHRAGATVIKVESPGRPDGARRGNPDFFDWMNGGKLSATVDFGNERPRIEALLRAADVVIEASRPRTLAQHGLSADQLPPQPGQVWLQITAYGAGEPESEWVGFGDDAAVAGGLVGRSTTGPVFCGDAIADPLTGIEAAAAVAEALAAGGGQMIEASLTGTAALYAALGEASEPEQYRARNLTAARPRFESLIVGPGPDLGAHNQEVDRLIAGRQSRS